MAEKKCLGTSNFLYICISIITFWNYSHTSAENGFTENHSARLLDAVPKNLPEQTLELDLSHNWISEIHILDFKYLSKLQVLILSHNFIRDLDFSVFQYNEYLQYLDLSYNHLLTLSCHPIASLQHLDLSYNKYTTMPICPEFVKMSKLEHLRLSARRIQKSDLSILANLQVGFLFLGLEDLSEYEELSVINAKSLSIALPQNSKFSILLHMGLNVTESLILSHMKDTQVCDLTIFLSKLNRRGRLLNLTLHNIEVNWNTVTTLFLTVWRSTMEYLSIYSVTLLEIKGPPILNYPETSLKALTIKGTEIRSTKFKQDIVYNTFFKMNIPSLTVSDSKMLQVFCPPKDNRFMYLCFSNNQLSDGIFEDCNNLTHLETLILQKNKLILLNRVGLMTSLMESLKVIDMSQNSLQYEDNEKCHWGENIVHLNLSANRLSDSVFRCLPVNIQVLDLHKNQISSIPKDIIELSHLEELNLASNKLTDLPGCGQFRSLRLLNVERNLGFSYSSEFFQTCQKIERLKVGDNPFTCSCELRQLINLEKKGSLKFVGWPKSYVCSSPEHLKGTLLTDFHVSEFVCNKIFQVVTFVIITLVLAATISFLCFRYDVPWYLKMIWQWTRVKHRVWSSKPEDVVDHVQFHAFISYSERDSDWVKNVLIPNLEKEDGSVRICQHERDFIAGKSIVENIIDCIEKSYKSIFVLSPNFVQSEWCHYELYFAHHRLFHENTDSLILLLLEPIPSYIIPARYHKLKALMAKRTYLEWPRENRKHGLFWANLKACIDIELPNSEEMNVL